MYKIKQTPEDFIVKEVNNVKLDDNGDYSYFSLKKRNYNTLKAIKIISEKLRINEKNIGFAGNKDKNAVTEQVISIKNSSRGIENINLKDIELKYLGKGNEEIYLGNLAGNEFTITLRNLSKKDIQKIKNKFKKDILMPNYFGPQRFSKSNHLIGKAIIKKDFRKALDLIIQNNSDYNDKIKRHLMERKNDFIGALRIIPSKLLKLYVHSYQSFLFNETLGQFIKTQKAKPNKTNNNNKSKNDNKNIIQKIPIIGFGTELKSNNISVITKKIMLEEEIDFRDFIIRQIPELSLEGAERSAFIKIKDFKIIKKEKDELNKNKEKIVVKFSLPKGCYATVLVDFLLN